MNPEHIPSGFPYKHVLEKGKPQHAKTDPFLIRHPSMPCSRRAKIFAPFDALKGFHEAVEAKKIEYVPKRVLSDSDLNALDEKLAELAQRSAALTAMTYDGQIPTKSDVRISVTYFSPCADPEHSCYQTGAGTYETITGYYRGISHDRMLMIDDMRIPVNNIEAMDLDIDLN